MRRQSFKKGIFVMSLANLINKGIGAVYIVILVYILTSKGMGILNNALNNYATLVVAFTTGFSAALAKIISENMSSGRYRHAHRIFKVSFYLFVLAGIIAALLMYIISMPLAISSDVFNSIYVLMPALFFAAISTVFRGYFQGMRYMTPIAVSQLFEQMVKIITAIALALLFMPDLSLAAFGAASGVTLGSICAVGVLAFYYISVRRELYYYIRGDIASPDNIAWSDIIKQVLSYAVPISLGGTIIQAIGSFDQLIFNKIFPIVGYSKDQITLLFGIYSSEVIKLVDIPSIITIAVAVNMLPAVSSAFAAGNMQEVGRKSKAAYRLASIISVPSAVGLSILAAPIISMVFANERNPNIGGEALQIFAISIIFISMIQVSTSILQGISRIYRPIRNILIGFAVKLAASMLIIIFPQYGLQLVALGTVLCYAVAAILDIMDVRKYTGFYYGMAAGTAKPIVASAAMAFSVMLIYNESMKHIGINAVALMISILGGMFVYSAVLFAIGGIKKEDIDFLFKRRR